ncbi:hypothetical protein D3C84_950830 [compost metagenome]
MLETGLDVEEINGFEGFNLAIPLHHQGEGRSLYPANRQYHLATATLSAQRVGTTEVHPNQPIGSAAP